MVQMNSHNFRKRTILIAEDSPGDRELIKRALENQPVELQFVGDGKEVQTYLQAGLADRTAEKPALIVLDLNMPIVCGRKVLEWIRGDFGDVTTPVVIFSSSDNPDDVRDCHKAGCSSYIVKPTDLEPFNSTLLAVTKYWLELVCLPER